jgi:anti-sigma-K factor RskA
MNNSETHTNRFEELCSAYVLGALEPDEQREFEEMMKHATPEERAAFHSFRSAATNLAFAAERAEPSASVKEQLMERIHRETGPSSADEGNDKGSPIRFIMAVAASILLLFAMLAYIFYSHHLHSKVNHQQAKITQLRNEVQKKQQLLSVLAARTVDLVTMKGQKVHPAGYGKIIWDPKKQEALLQVSNLPALPAGKVYQLWLIKNKKPIPSGLFDVSHSGQNYFFKVRQLAKANQQNANAFAITLEPKGGSPQPTGAMYLVGKVKKKTV